MMIKRRQFTKEFKLQVLREIEAGASIAHAARQHHLHPNVIRKWREQYARYADRAYAHAIFSTSCCRSCFVPCT